MRPKYVRVLTTRKINHIYFHGILHMTQMFCIIYSRVLQQATKQQWMDKTRFLAL
jgi:hypothetical protein